MKIGRSIPRLVKRLKTIAFKGARPVLLREKDQETGKVTTRTVWMPVSDSVQLAAIQELMSRGLGKSTVFKVIEDVTPQAPVVMSVETIAAALDRLGVPPDRQPPEVQEFRRRKVESRVLEPPPHDPSVT